MIHRGNGTWRITAAADLTQLADRLGVLDAYRAQIARNRKDRADWHAHLERHLPEQQVTEEDLYDVEQDENWLPPPDAATWHQHIYQAA